MRAIGMALSLGLSLGLALAACADDPTVGPTGSTGATAPTGPTATPGPTGPSTTTSPPIAPELEDGEHFGFVQSADADGGTMVFDLAYFLTGQEAIDAAKEHGDEFPPPNDYYIVNDNPKLRTLALASDVELDLLDWSNCCDERFAGDLAAFASAFEQGGSVEVGGRVYQGPLSPYWLTVEGGVVVRIEEQYLP